jgi:phosphatidate cytidylyltransferase
MARIISAVILIPLAILAVIYVSPVLLLIAIGIIGTFCLYEYFGLIRAMGIKTQPLFSYLAFWILLISMYQKRFPASILIALVLMSAFLSSMWRVKQPVRERTWTLMAELLGILYFALFLYPAVSIRFDFGNKIGLQWTLILLIVIWAGDSAALAAGKAFGKTRLAPVLSPKKTYEGAAAGWLAGIGFAAAAQCFLFSELPMQHVILASALLGLAGQLGDLAESMLKRAADIKDSSHIIPGHGGVLDRMDSLLFAFPVLYFYLFLLYR